MARRSIRGFLIRFVIASTVLGFLVARIGWNEIGERLAVVDPIRLLLPLALVFAEATLRAYNWYLLLRALSENVSFPRMLYIYMIGSFFGGLVPSSVGSDVARSTTLAKRDQVPVRASIASVTMLSMIDIVAAGALVLVAAPIVLDVVPIGLIGAVAIVLAGVGVHALLRRRPHLGERIRRLLPETAREGIERVLECLAAVNASAIMLRVLTIGFLSRVADVLIAWTVAWAFDLPIGFMYFVAFVPVVLLARVLPISLARFGGEQLVFVTLFTRAGVAPATALTLSLTISLLNTAYLLASGVLYVARSARTVARRPAGDH